MAGVEVSDAVVLPVGSELDVMVGADEEVGVRHSNEYWTDVPSRQWYSDGVGCLVATR
jgi:hypothetical protein